MIDEQRAVESRLREMRGGQRGGRGGYGGPGAGRGTDRTFPVTCGMPLHVCVLVPLLPWKLVYGAVQRGWQRGERAV